MNLYDVELDLRNMGVERWRTRCGQNRLGTYMREGKAKLNGLWSWRRSGRKRSYLLMGKPDILQLPVGLS